MLIALLLTTSLASATDVGTTRKLGAGLALPWPTEITAKLWFDEQSGVAAFVGGYYVYPSLRMQYERDLAEIDDFEWARFSAYWDVGGEVDYYPAPLHYQAGVGLGVYAGAAARLQFHDAPFEVFAGPDIGVRYVTYTGISPVKLLVHGTLGVRYYW